jgi:hypothetical protein
VLYHDIAPQHHSEPVRGILQVRYRVLGQHQQEQLRSFTMDRRWYPMALYTCEDLQGVGSWTREPCPDPPPPPPPKLHRVRSRS